MNKMTNRLIKLSCCTPILISLLPLFFLFHKNPAEVWFSDFLILCIFLSIATLIILFLFSLVRNLPHAALSTTIFFIPLLIVNESFSYRNNVVIWVIFTSLALASLFFSFQQQLIIKIHQAIIAPLFFILIFYGVLIGISKYRILKTKNELFASLTTDLLALKANQKAVIEADRDIYFIVLDEYISPNTFRNYYQYDNENFFSFLSSSNFHLVRFPYSNYAWTIPSLSSMLSLNYHKNWVDKKEFPQIAHYLLQNNITMKLLESEGYSIHNIPSIYWLPNKFKKTKKDFLFRAKSYGPVLSIMRATPFALMAREFQRREQKKHIENQLLRIQEIIELPQKKKFVFAHFLCPHRPIVFDREGKYINGSAAASAEKDKNHTYYLDQAYFISQSIQKLVDNILEKSTIPPLIVLMSDHGKFPIGVSGKGKQTLPMDILSWRFSNFIALHLPQIPSEIPEVLTPINVFRMILSDYYGYNLPQLENFCHHDFFNFEEKNPTISLIPYQNK